MGYDPLVIQEKHVTTPLIAIELQSNNVIWLRFQLAIETGRLELRTPSPNYVVEIHEVITQTGDTGRLSRVDIEILAIALELHVQGYPVMLVSDDYSVQNVAKRLQVAYTSLSTFGIRYEFKWICYCPACYRKYVIRKSKSNCDFCGTLLKKKALKKI